MKIEELIRARHEFEDDVREFLDLASAMSNRELEIALARLADMLNEEKEEEASIRVSGELLKIYYDLRTRGVKRQFKFKRGLLGKYSNSPEDLIEELTSWDLLPENCVAIPQPPDREDPVGTVKLLAP